MARSAELGRDVTRTVAIENFAHTHRSGSGRRKSDNLVPLAVVAAAQEHTSISAIRVPLKSDAQGPQTPRNTRCSG